MILAGRVTVNGKVVTELGAKADWQTDRIEPAIAITKEIELTFVFGYTPEEFAATLHDIAEGRLDVGDVVTGKVELDGVAQAFKDLGDPEAHVKILVEP